jgi:protein gp37
VAQTSRIEWTEATWNPVTGCHQISPGCAHCYAKTFAERWRGIPGHHYEQGFDLRLWPERLEQPLRWRRPRVIFVNSMSDLFHEGIPDEYIMEVFNVMASAPQHTFQVLTKRDDRLATLASRLPWPANVWMGVTTITDYNKAVRTLVVEERIDRPTPKGIKDDERLLFVNPPQQSMFG